MFPVIRDGAEMEKFYSIGVDVQVSRGCSFMVLDSELSCVTSGWLGGTAAEIGSSLKSLSRSWPGAVGIDAPRQPLSQPREHYWDKRRCLWRPRDSSEKGYGRHCEVVVKGLGLANPIWTPLAGECPAWMELGFALFEALAGHANVYEVYPSATYSILRGRADVSVKLNFAHFAPGPKDMIDACACAVTVHEFMDERGLELGGGDGLGSIVVPAIVIDTESALLSWPA